MLSSSSMISLLLGVMVVFARIIDVLPDVFVHHKYAKANMGAGQHIRLLPLCRPCIPESNSINLKQVQVNSLTLSFEDEMVSQPGH